MTKRFGLVFYPTDRRCWVTECLQFQTICLVVSFQFLGNQIIQGSNESKHLRWRPPNIGTKQEWQDRLRNIGKGKKGVEDEKAEYSTMAVPFYDENLYLLNMKNDIEAKVSFFFTSFTSVYAHLMVFFSKLSILCLDLQYIITSYSFLVKELYHIHE